MSAMVRQIGSPLSAFASWCSARLKANSDRRPRTYRDVPRADGTARYDDVWGG